MTVVSMSTVTCSGRRCSTTGDITTLWPGPIQPLGMAVYDTSLYVTTSERSDDGLRGLGALLALPAAR